MNIYLLNATINGKLLSEILCRRIDIKGIITLDDDGVFKTNEYYDYSDFCQKRGIDCIKLKTYNLSDSLDRDRLEILTIDLIIVASWQRLLPEWLISKCSIGIIGAHGSHEGIERGRGRSPQNWALLTGQTKFSLSIFWIESGTDNGDIIDTVEFDYLMTDTILSSYVKVNLNKANMILKNLENGRIVEKQGTHQNKKGLYLPQRKKEDGQIDWHRDAMDIYNMIRALTKPYPGAFSVCDEEEFYFWSACPIITEASELYNEYEDGCIVSVLENSVLIKCGSNMLLVNDCTGFEKMKEGMVFESVDYYHQMENIIERHYEKYNTPLSRLVLDEIEKH